MDDACNQLISKLLIIIVIYNIDLEKCPSFISLYDDLKANNNYLDVVIYDNSEVPQKINTIKYYRCNFQYIHDYSNGGVGKGYNAGAKIAETLNKDWVIFVDQDSVFPVNSINTYLSEIVSNPNIQVFSPILRVNENLVVSPSIFKFHRGFAPNKISPGINSLKKYSPVNSGLCVSLNLFKKVNGYNEAIKLDYSDFAFIAKVKKQTTDFKIMDLYINHGLSSYERVPLKAAKSRFAYLCRGAILSSESSIQTIMAGIVIFTRCIKLVVVYKNPSFFKIAINASFR